jgi:hypothetical protein
MTDTLITVDLQFQKLLQRAREGQAAGREVQVDREQQRKVEAAGRAERGVRERITIPGQVLQQGRSRRGVHSSPQNVTRRPKEQPAAGYVQQVPEVAYGFIREFIGDSDYFFRVYSGNGGSYEDIQIPQLSSTGSLPTTGLTPGGSLEILDPSEGGAAAGTYVTKIYSPYYLVLPAGGQTFLVLFKCHEVILSYSWQWVLIQAEPPVYIFEGETTETMGTITPELCIVSKRSIRKVSSLPKVAGDWVTALWLLRHGNYYGTLPDPESLVTLPDDLRIMSQGLSAGIGSVGSGYINGTLSAIRTMLEQPPGWSPTWLSFVANRSSTGEIQFWQGNEIRSLDDDHYPVPGSKGKPIRGLKIPQIPNATGGTATPRVFTDLLLAWDWGKPALCRQLLLQLGFSPSDLSP